MSAVASPNKSRVEDLSPRTTMVPSSPVVTDKDLEAALDDAMIAMNLYMDNKIKEGRRFTLGNHNKTFYHSALMSLLRAFEAILTMDKDDVARAIAVVTRSIESCERAKVKTVPGSKPVINFSNYTDAQMHAELCYAECNLAKAVLHLIEESGVVALTKAAVALKRVQIGYATCRQMVDKAKFSSKKSKDCFTVGVHLGLGAVHLFLGSAPEKVVKLIDVHNTKFSSETGRNLLQKGFNTKDTARTNICGIVLLMYYMYINFIWGVSPVPFEAFDPVLQHFVKTHPKGAVTLFLTGKRDQLKGEFESSNKHLKDAISVVPDLPAFHGACHWEMMFNSLLTGEYKQGIHFADLLLKHSAWSKCSYAYMKAVMLMASGGPTDQVRTLMRNVPMMKRSLGTKYLPTENFFEFRAGRFLAQGGKLVCPAIEQVYLWRGFQLLRGRKDVLDKFEKALNEEQTRLKDDANLKAPDHEALIKLLRGGLLRARGDDKASLPLFEAAARVRAVNDHHIVPFATMELGLLDLKNGHVPNAMNLFKRALTSKQRYFFEVRLQFRIDAATRLLNEVTKKTSGSRKTSR